MSYRFTKASLLTGTIMAGAMFAAPLHAQTATGNTDDATDQEPALQAAPDNPETVGFSEPIIVTGSRIARRNVETAAPVAVVGDEEFQLSGTVNVENVINTLPQVIPGTTSFSNNPGNGTATLNLRGLGTNRNLVLVNGRRWMFFDTTQVVDLNTIPSFLIDSVDVVTGGASAVYGSDALAGVVNFRLRDVEGVEFGGQYGLTEEGDGETYEIHGAIGTAFADGRGNATVFAEYYNRSSVFQGDRGFSRFALSEFTFGPPLTQGGSSLLPQGRLNYSGTGNRAGTDFASNGGVVFDAPGDFRPLDGDAYNYAPVNYLQIPQERYLMGGYADYDIGGGHTFYTEVTFVNNRVATELAATPVGIGVAVDLASVQGFLTPGDFAQLQQLDATETGTAGNDGIVNLTVRRRITETGPRNSLDERNAFRVLGGVRGPIGDYLQYDANYFYARTRNANIQSGNISSSAFVAGLDGTGEIPLNIFGLNTLTPEMVDSITIQAQNGDISTLEVVNATISGTFGDFALGTAAPIGFAVGTEYRKVASEFLPDTALSSGDVIGFNAGQATEGTYDVKEAFGELNIPVEFGSARLELNGAARYSQYSLENVGDAFTYAGGVQFSPIPDVTFRAQYQRAIRAPNIAELYQGSAIGFPAATDPCGTSAAVAAGALRDLCIANGVPAANLGNAGILDPDVQIAALFGGNPDLEEETSDSFTVGVVLQPVFVPGLTITADYFDITVENAISTLGLNSALALCFGDENRAPAGSLADPNCEAFIGTRDATGAFDRQGGPLLGGANIAEIGVSGVDLEVNYTSSLPFSLFTDTGEQRVNLSFLGTWTESSYFIADVAEPDIIDECSGQFGVAACGEPTPEFKWTSRASFIDGPVTTSIAWRHVSAVGDDDDGRNYAARNGVETIEAYDLIDLSFGFDIYENFSMNLGVNNLFNTLPDTPVFDANGNVVGRPNSLLLGDNQDQANTYPSTYDVLGRRYFVSGTFKF
tara:strand:- start:3424 stop:6387 length:2964 start_codon:yes stop_codon:yes gene_type:complete